MVNSAQKYRNVFGSLRGLPPLSPEAMQILAGKRLKVEGTQTILDIFRQARAAERPVQQQPYQAPPPRQAPPVTHAVTMQDARKKYPGVPDAVLRRAMEQQGIHPIE
jgi:hypothetical protein